MLGIHWPEFMLIAVVTVLVLGPKELPRVLRTVTYWVRRLRKLSSEFQSTMNDLAREADLDDVKKDFTDIEHGIGDMRIDEDLEKSLDGDNKIAGMFTGDVGGTDDPEPRPRTQSELYEEDDVEVPASEPPRRKADAAKDPGDDAKGGAAKQVAEGEKPESGESAEAEKKIPAPDSADA